MSPISRETRCLIASLGLASAAVRDVDNSGGGGRQFSAASCCLATLLILILRTAFLISASRNSSGVTLVGSPFEAPMPIGALGLPVVISRHSPDHRVVPAHDHDVLVLVQRAWPEVMLSDIAITRGREQ